MINFLFYCLWIRNHSWKAFPTPMLQRNSPTVSSTTYIWIFNPFGVFFFFPMVWNVNQSLLFSKWLPRGPSTIYFKVCLRPHGSRYHLCHILHFFTHLGLVLEFLLGLTGLSDNSRTHAAVLIMEALQDVLTSGRDSFILSLPVFGASKWFL